MRRYACYIDVGYLYAEGARLLSGQWQPRHAVHVDYDAFLTCLDQVARSRVPQAHLLRIYWYDGARGGPTPAQLAIGYRDDLKLRLGVVDAQGHQRGVDALLVRDLVLDAHHRNITDALVLSGDDDLRGGILAAQEMGVRVQLVGVGDGNSNNQSRALLMEADGVALIDSATVARWMTVRPSIDDNDPDDDPEDRGTVVQGGSADHAPAPAAAGTELAGPQAATGAETTAATPADPAVNSAEGSTPTDAARPETADGGQADDASGTPPQPLPAGSSLEQATRTLALEFSASLDLEELEEITRSWSVARQGIPPRYDRALVWQFGQLWPQDVGPTEKRVLRQTFVDVCQHRLQTAQGG